jgi:hypothetical protein
MAGDAIDALFVQSAAGLTCDGGTITLHEPSAATVYFTEQPTREAGHVPTRRFVELWDAEGGGFAAQPPAAVLSFVEPDDGSGAPSDAVVALREPRLDADSLAYEVDVLDGSLPQRAGPCTLFIDASARPLSPAVSAAKPARRR